MILADTVIWADHLARADPMMRDLLDRAHILMHPFVLGEIALGSLQDRARVLADLNDLLPVQVATVDEVSALIERLHLHGTGIGYVGAHLIAATLLTDDTQLWTRDKRLNAVAERLGIAARFAN